MSPPAVQRGRRRRRPHHASPCLLGTAHARLEVTWPPDRGTGQRILEDSAFGWLNGELLQMVGFGGHEGFHTGNPAVHIRAAPIEQINATTGTNSETQRLSV
jgi:hypothetical protein